MSQHDLDIANQGFPATRADLNLALKALGSSNSGATAPSTTYANQLWYDTANNILKIRNEDNDAWISIMTLDQTADAVTQINVDNIRIDGNTISSTDTNGNVNIDPAGTGSIVAAQVASSSLDIKGDRTDAQITLKGGSAGAGMQLFGSTYTNYAGAMFLDATASTTGTNDAEMVFRTGSGPSEAMRIDRSQNVLVGTTTNGTTADGTVIRASAETLMTRSNGAPLLVNRRGSDGAAIEVRNDNAVVGYINANASGMGVYLGGTAAANHLDDYEEGNFTVTVSSGISISSYDHQLGHYVKVGRQVTAWVFMEYNGSSRTGAHFIISGLPFNTSDSTSDESTFGGFITYQNGFSNTNNIVHVPRGTNIIQFYEVDGSTLIGSELSGASGEIRVVVQYTVP